MHFRPISYATIVAIFAFVATGIAPASAWAGCVPTALTIDVDPCAEAGTQVVAHIEMTNPIDEIIGVQFSLEFSQSNYQLVSVTGVSPFSMTIAGDASIPGQANLFSVLVFPGQPGSDEDQTVALVRFNVLSTEGHPFIRFRKLYYRDDVLDMVLLTDWGGYYPPKTENAPDNDQDKTLRDMADFQSCFTGEDGDGLPMCRCWFDHDNDGDIDYVDYEEFQSLWTDPDGLSCPSE